MPQPSGKRCDGTRPGCDGPRPGDSRARARTEAPTDGPNARLKRELNTQIDELLLPGDPATAGRNSP